MIDIIWVHVCTQGWRSRGSRATVKDPTRSIVVWSHVLRGEHPCKTKQVTMREREKRKRKNSASTEAAGDGLYTHEWAGLEGRKGSGLDVKRHEGHERVAPRQTRPGEQKQKLTTAGCVGLFGGEGEREIDGGRREQNRSSLHVSKGQPLPQYVLSRCLQTGCTFRRKWIRLCLDSAVGSGSRTCSGSSNSQEVVGGGSGSDHARVRKARPRRPVKSIRQSVNQSGSSRSVKIERPAQGLTGRARRGIFVGRGPGSGRWTSGPA